MTASHGIASAARKTRAFATVPVVLGVVAVSCGAPRTQEFAGTVAPGDLSGVIAPLLAASRLPALGAAVVTSDGLEAIGAVGVRSWTGTEPVTINDQWHIGSCTKAMTATLVARLVDQGVLGWETTVASVLGPAIHPGWKDVPILWLLSHRSGAPGNFSDRLWQEMAARSGTPREQRRWFVEQALKSPPATPPNTETVYSNSGFIVAGVMLEVLTGTSWEALMRREVFVPLGMTRSGFGAPGNPGKLDEPLGHTPDADGWVPVPLGPGDDNPAAAGPAGTIHTTLGDWSRFIAAHLRGARGDERFLKTGTWRRLHTPGGAGWEYSPGWVVAERDWAGGNVLRHLGSNNFWLAEATLVPSQDVAVLLVTNVSDDAVERPFKELLTALIADHAWTQADSIVAIGSGRIRLTTSAWRDFMPRVGGDQRGSDLMVNLQVQGLDGVPLPTGLAVDSAWVRSTEGLWSSAPSPEPRPDLPNGLDLMLRGGPKWDTGQEVDVLVRLRRSGGGVHYLQTRRQPIGRTN